MPGRPSATQDTLAGLSHIWNTHSTMVEPLHATATLKHIGGPLTCQEHPQQHWNMLVDLLCAGAAQEPLFWMATHQQTAHNVTANCKTLLLVHTLIKQAPSSIITAPACHFTDENCVLSFILLHWVVKRCLL